MSSVIGDSKVLEILQKVYDPEIPVLSIIDLGIVHSVKWVDEKLKIEITPTYTGCPAMDMIAVDIKAILQDAGYENVEVKLVLTPAWTTDWITDNGKKVLKAYGIAPPVEKTTDKSFIQNESKKIACPQCGSENTELVSLFGSTPCKSLYKCLDCSEPFDYFKCH